MEYLAYTAKDFVKDSHFQKWVLDPDDETDAFWQAWLTAHPHKKAVVEEAREMAVVLGFQADLEANKAFIEVWEHIHAAN